MPTMVSEKQRKMSRLIPGTRTEVGAEPPPRVAPKPEHRLSQLDFLRGVAILLVLGAHQPNTDPGKLRLVAGLMGRFGWSGVDLFFVLSGFLVGGLIFREVVTKQRFDPVRFMVRRAFKIWPLYYLYITVATVIMFVQDRTRFAHDVVAVIVPCVFNYENMSHSFVEDLPHIWAPMGMIWSLAVEEHFYLLLTALFAFALATRPTVRALRLVALVCVSCIPLCLTLRFVLLWNQPFTFITHVWPTYLRIDGLCWGVLLAYVYHVQPSWWEALRGRRRAILAASLLLLLPMVLLSHEKSRLVYTFGYTFLYVGYGGLLVVLMQTTVGQGRIGSLVGSPVGRLTAAIGRSSYSIYLWQLMLAGELVTTHLSLIPFQSIPALHWLLAMSATVVLSIIEGALIARLIEVPTLLVRNRLFPARSEATRATGVS